MHTIIMPEIKVEQEYLIKLILIGSSSVGKTSVIRRFTDGNFCDSYCSTFGIDFKVQKVDLGGKKVKLQLWDTGDQLRFRTITQSYYRGADGILFLYDTTNLDSYNDLPRWLQESDMLVLTVFYFVIPGLTKVISV